MTDSLLDLVRHHAMAHADQSGVASTPIRGLTTICTTLPGELQYAISKPMVVLVLQGGKRVSMGRQTFDFGAGDSLVITADVPTVSQITAADANSPYYSLVLDLDPVVIESLVAESHAVAVNTEVAPIRVEATEDEVADAALRLLRLLHRPQALPILRDSLVREMHYWLLMGKHGAEIRTLGLSGSHVHRIAKAVALIRAAFAESIPLERLAATSGMSVSSFHQHFRAITSLSPLQFQKQLRLIEARRMMLSEGALAKSAAFAVGYESINQFTREYGRFFGMPPAKDIKVALGRLPAS
jgi:AraC-like DNA-binding protein